ncbi:MAG TPA: hypothetical protein VHK91_04820 [Flavisolibacter sp.]|jgi:hypothetical protein|nr:hypothetical protein [Flavisolibacter sp.]
MIRKLMAILILTACLAQVFNRSLIIVDYYANKAAFEKYCINKARPMLHCNGKCQMMKKLKEEERQQEQNTERRYGNPDVVSSKSFFATLPPVQRVLASLSFAAHHFTIPSGISKDMFHPPSFS